MRRISTPIDSSGKLIPPRKLHSTQWGNFICPTETPEGASVGVVKNLALTCEITDYTEPNIIIDKIIDYITGFKNLDILTFNKNKNSKVFINGIWLGYTNTPKELIERFKYFRNRNNINIYSSIYVWEIENNEIFIYTDRGRCIRPLLKSNKLDINLLKNKSWYEYIVNLNIIEYIDSHEIINCVLCNSPDKLNNNITHSEIHPYLILGVLASCIPFLNHNQSPRNTYQSAMGKQAIGINCLNNNNKYDTFTHQLYYPQRPLISTNFIKNTNVCKLPNGINVVVAI